MKDVEEIKKQEEENKEDKILENPEVSKEKRMTKLEEKDIFNSNEGVIH